jgi:hypothetical protein
VKRARGFRWPTRDFLVSRRRRLRPRACTIWGGCRAETERPNLRGGFGPKNATSVGGARRPVDCIKRRVPGRGGGASFFSRTFFERSRKEASTTKTKKAFNASSESAWRMYNEEAHGVALEETFVLRRESNVFRITERRERLAGEKPPERCLNVFNEKKETSTPITRTVTRIQSHVSSHVSSHERSFALCITSQRAREPSSVRASSSSSSRAVFFFFLAAASFASFASSRTQHRSIGVLAHALVTFAASMSVTAFLPAFTCAWTRSMAAAASVSSRAARADESPTRELNRL